MPIVPEKLSSRNSSRSAIASQFWESSEHSSRYIDGQAWKLPCEPPALNLTGSSGLSRAQQIISAQSMGLPLFPSYDGNSGGLVLDRVLAKVGGRRWWTALSGRVKAQRVYSAAAAGTQPKVQALRDLRSYALCARTRLQLSRRLTFNGVVEAPDVLLLHSRLRGGNPAAEREEWAAMHATLRAVLTGHDLTASIGRNMDYVESSGDYARVPHVASLDLSSHDRSDGLQYRVGLHQATAPITEAGGKGRGRQAVRSVLHAQGAVAVEGEAFVWRAGGGAKAAAAKEAQRPAGAKEGAGPGGAAAEGAEAAGVGGRVAEVLAAAAAADMGDAVEAGGGEAFREAVDEAAASPEEGGAAPPEAAAASKSGAGEESEGGAAAAEAGPQLPSLEGFIRPLEKLGDALHSYTHPAPPPPLPSPKGAAAAEGGALAAAHPGPERLLPITSESVSAAIADSLALLSQLRQTVSRVTGDVREGSLQRLSEQLSRRQAPRRRPYSLLLANPHLKINAAMGCLARMPLPSLRGFALAPQDVAAAGGGDDGGVGMPLGGGGGQHRRSGSVGSGASRASYSSQLAEVWEPYLKGTALRVFASAGVSGQVGRFTRPFLDYTAASLRVDLGLTSPHVVGAVPGATASSSPALSEAHRPDKHRAFALEGRASWHALSVSLAQQLVGPVRARADFRFALDPTHVPQDQGERSTVKGLAQTALSVRPSLLEAVYGADVVLPGTEGAARVAMWWSPKRREAMAELRLF